MQRSNSLTEVVKTLQAALAARRPEDDLFTSPLIGKAPLDLMKVNPGAVTRLAYSKLHSYYPFSEVPRCWRRCYEEACLWDILQLLEQCRDDSPSSNIEDEIIKLCDDAIILAGAPGRQHLIDLILDAINDNADTEDLKTVFQIDSFEPDEPAGDDCLTDTTSFGLAVATDESGHERPFKKLRLQSSNGDVTLPEIGAADLPTKFLSKNPLTLNNFKSTHPVSRIKSPSLDTFANLLSCLEPTPAVLTGCLGHWPALTRWRDPRYWIYRTHQGRRRVPVEWGKSYVDEAWGQSVIPFGQFLREELLGLETHDVHELTSTKTSCSGSGRRTGYLAQHDLLSQIPALRNDIAVPDYCYCSVDDAQDDTSDVESVEPLLNIWLGPAETVSPAHTDPHHNLLAQVVGRKYVRLFSPEQTPHMYPMDDQEAEEAGADCHKGYSMANTSSVDVGLEVTDLPHPSLGVGNADEDQAVITEKLNAQRHKFPDFHEKAQWVECVLEPGEMLFIPRGWWHYIRSLEVSCNVSFWWD